MRINTEISTNYPPIFGQVWPQRTPQQFCAVPYTENDDMSEVLFKLRNPDAKKATSINVYYWYDKKRFVASVRRSIHPNEWDDKKMRPKRSYFAYQSLKIYLDKIEAAIVERHNYLLAFGRYPTPEHFRDAVRTLSGVLRMDRPTLREHLDNLCKKHGSGSMYHRLRTQLKRYLDDTRASVDFDAINEPWFDDFQNWLIQSNKSELYSNRMIKQFKMAIKRTGFDFEGKTEILNAKVKAAAAAGESEYWKPSDLAKLYSAKLTGRASDVRYMALFACVTGLRISDWQKFDLSGPVIEVNGVKFLRIVTQKTSTAKSVIVAYPPLLSFTQKILNIYGGPIPEYWRNVPEKAFQWEFNQALRAMGEAAGFTEQVEKVKRSKGKTFTVTAPRYTFFSSKIGRKSFVSNMRSCGAPDNLIGLMTGHKIDRSIIDTYDVRRFEEKAPGLIRYLRDFETKLPGDLDDWITSLGKRY